MGCVAARYKPLSYLGRGFEFVTQAELCLLNAQKAAQNFMSTKQIRPERIEQEAINMKGALYHEVHLNHIDHVLQVFRLGRDCVSQQKLTFLDLSRLVHMIVRTNCTIQVMKWWANFIVLCPSSVSLNKYLKPQTLDY